MLHVFFGHSFSISNCSSTQLSSALVKLAESETFTFSKTMNLAQKFIKASDICKTHEEPSSNKRKHEYVARANAPRDVPRKERYKKPCQDDNGHDPHYNLNRREIYLDIKEKYTLSKPDPIRTDVNKRDKTLWSEYHDDCGHTTHNCRELKRALDKLADEEKLNRYLKDRKEKKKEPRNMKEAHLSIRISQTPNSNGGEG